MNNGMFQVVGSQLFLFLGFWFSGAAIGDCDLIKIQEEIVVREDGATATSIGMASYQDDTGKCYYWTDVIETNVLLGGSTTLSGNDQIEHYVTEVLGNNWFIVYGLCATAFAFSLLAFMYSVSYCCSTQVRPARALWGFIVIVIAAVQGVGISWIYNAPWCSDLDGGCTMGRSTIWGIVACACFLVSGICFLAMSDYPGKAYIREQKAAKLTTAQEQDDLTDSEAGGVTTTQAMDLVEDKDEIEMEDEFIEEEVEDEGAEGAPMDVEKGKDDDNDNESGDDDILEEMEEVVDEKNTVASEANKTPANV